MGRSLVRGYAHRRRPYEEAQFRADAFDNSGRCAALRGVSFRGPRRRHKAVYPRRRVEIESGRGAAALERREMDRLYALGDRFRKEQPQFGYLARIVRRRRAAAHDDEREAGRHAGVVSRRRHPRVHFREGRRSANLHSPRRRRRGAQGDRFSGRRRRL